MGASKPSLFERLPFGIFDPLTGPHAARYMRVLERLYSDFFGPDAEPGPDDGFLRKRVIAAVHSYLLEEPWPKVGGDDERASPIELQVESIFDRLCRSGWLVTSDQDIRMLVAMPMNVHHLLGLLLDFAQHGPVYIGGTIQVIYNHLLQVAEKPEEQAEGFHNAAGEARRMMDALSRTRGRAHEFRQQLGNSESTAEYAARFFDDYVADLFGVAYHQLRTADHPLRHRHEILSIVTELREIPEKREALLRWYKANQRQLGDPEIALEKDISLFMRFESIERHLDRLDSAFHRVHSQAINYFKYSIRTPGRIETAISEAIDMTATASGPMRGLYVFARLPFSEIRLKLPERRGENEEREIVKRRAPTQEQLAKARLDSAMRRHRQISRVDLEQYVSRNGGAKATIYSDDLNIETIKDLCVFMTLSREATSQPIQPQSPPASYRIRRVAGETSVNDYVRVARFVIERSLERENVAS